MDERSDATDWTFILFVMGTVAVLVMVIGAVLWLKGPLQTECGGFSCGYGSSVSNAPDP